MTPIDRTFYQRHPAEVAPELLGKILVRQLPGVTLAGRIVETEAYASDDPASHTFRGLTERNKAMFGETGCAYIYFIHGLHYCLNVTARLNTAAGGVLIRALEPLQGIETMQKLRAREDIYHLTSGPAKLTQAMAIDKALYGVDMTAEGSLFIGSGELRETQAVRATPRIGISLAKDVPWRFILEGNRFVSKSGSHLSISGKRK